MLSLKLSGDPQKAAEFLERTVYDQNKVLVAFQGASRGFHEDFRGFESALGVFESVLKSFTSFQSGYGSSQEVSSQEGFRRLQRRFIIRLRGIHHMGFLRCFRGSQGF